MMIVEGKGYLWHGMKTTACEGEDAQSLLAILYYSDEVYMAG